MPPLEPVLSLDGLNGVECHAPDHIWHPSGGVAICRVALQLLRTDNAQTVPRVYIEDLTAVKVRRLTSIRPIPSLSE